MRVFIHVGARGIYGKFLYFLLVFSEPKTALKYNVVFLKSMSSENFVNGRLVSWNISTKLSNIYPST